MPANDSDETRAEIARRRLVELAASFQASLPDSPESGAPVSDDGERYADPEDPADSGLRKRRVVALPQLKFLVGGAALALLGTGWWLFSAGAGAGNGLGADAVGDSHVAVTPASSQTSEGADPATPETLIVHVAGSVKKPGIVTVKAGSRVADAIAAAGGVTGKADVNELDLARVLVDGEQIRIALPPPLDPSAGAAGASGSAGTQAGAGASAQSTINLNTASQAELETLPGVGPVTAQAILDWRHKNQRFETVDDLLDIRGIGEATLERLRPLVSV